MNTENLLYVIPAGQYGKEGILALLEQHPEIKFVSLVGVDLAGNDTDEKIPISVFFDDYESFFDGSAFQTDGSSVVLPGIAINLAAQFVKKLRRLQIICSDNLSGSADPQRKS